MKWKVLLYIDIFITMILREGFLYSLEPDPKHGLQKENRPPICKP